MRISSLLIIVVAVLTALLSSVVALPAWAECAWVLWRETTYLATGYTPMLATTKKDCNARKAEYQRRPRPETIDKDAGLRYVCLPDTIDPREPRRGQQ
jgi:hypothetical protein